MPPPNLTTIPLETLTQVILDLDRKDCSALRLVCRKFDFILLPIFAKRYFEIIRFMRTKYSLQALVDISESRLASYLKHVLIEIDAPILDNITVFAYLQNHDEEVAVDRLSELAVAETIFLGTGRDQEMLTKAFRNLQLETIGVRTSGLEDAFDSKIRSLGTHKIYKETNLDLFGVYCGNRQSSQLRSLAKFLDSILFALVESGARPRRFEIDTYFPSLGGTDYDILRFPKRDTRPMVSSLEVIQITIKAAHIHVPGRHLHRFLSQADHLKTLCITSEISEEFSHWLAAPVSSNDYYMLPPALTELRECRFSACKLPMLGLLRLIEKCLNLRVLGLSMIECVDFRQFDDVGLDKDVLIQLLKKIFQSSTHLEFISLSEFVCKDYPENGDCVAFAGNNAPPRRLFFYEGPNMKEELEAVEMVVRNRLCFDEDGYLLE
ncbi:hypothetical protein K445DRAFT_317858 [Daldinia sp. EC12]|nr:hypothetical protein K445DRAFT_317858 [Daldinia sp. EC12]